MAAISLGFIVIVTPYTIQEVVAACTGSKVIISPNYHFRVCFIPLFLYTKTISLDPSAAFHFFILSHLSWRRIFNHNSQLSSIETKALVFFMFSMFVELFFLLLPFVHVFISKDTLYIRLMMQLSTNSTLHLNYIEYSFSLFRTIVFFYVQFKNKTIN